MPIQSFTNLDSYYEDDSQWGNHQYTYLSNIVNNFMFEVTEDSYIKNVNRQKVSYHSKRVIQELYYDVVNEVISIELDLNPTLIVALPHDYVNYVSIGWVDENGRKHPMAIDAGSNLAQAYLQDNNYEYLYDNDGDILQGTHIQDTEANQTFLDFYNYDGYATNVNPNYNRSTVDYNLDRSKVFKNGSYVIDKERGIIQFSSTVRDRTIYIDYISDGLFQRTDEQIRVHKFAEQAVYDYIYWRLVNRNRNVPRNEKEGARRDWFNSRRVSKRRINNVKYEEIRQVMKSQDKMIKG